MVFEAEDAGFSTGEICEYAGRDRGTVEKVLENREELESRIVRVLQFLYNNKSITKPYRSEECVFRRDV